MKMIVNFIASGKRKKLEAAFKANPVLLKHIDDYKKVHDEYMTAQDKLKIALDRVCSKTDCNPKI